MKITKAHIQIGILAIGGLSVAGMWLVPQFDTPPSISVPAKQTTPSPVASTPSPKALPDTVAPVVKKKPKPQSVTPTLTLDVNAQKLIKRSEQLAVAKMDSQIAEEKSRTRKANQKESREGRSDYVPSVAVIEQPYSPPPLPSVPTPLNRPLTASRSVAFLLMAPRPVPISLSMVANRFWSKPVIRLRASVSPTSTAMGFA
ncbi:hypothetical protein JHT19_25645 (plasmid) [Vibrio parahaemolyticus]|uniref:hypothetical protein n=1 Tax=Vibrio parahaemolyticus TaxID=670 RepID=UPI000E0BD7F9|nr:hypothetical protein [Vibrio parahaemolyticus]MRD99989.1 hypothetical protein [Vibrio parahaemolyticus]UJX11797.1 hypothetical protein JHT19_25645 [Vibrio parahaemolyticus]